MVFTDYAQKDFEELAKQLFVCKEDKQTKRFDRLFVSLSGHRVIKRFILEKTEQMDQVILNNKQVLQLLVSHSIIYKDELQKAIDRLQDQLGNEQKAIIINSDYSLNITDAQQLLGVLQNVPQVKLCKHCVDRLNQLCENEQFKLVIKEFINLRIGLVDNDQEGMRLW